LLRAPSAQCLFVKHTSWAINAANVGRSVGTKPHNVCYSHSMMIIVFVVSTVFCAEAQLLAAGMHGQSDEATRIARRLLAALGHLS